jgi:hypothetical protein
MEPSPDVAALSSRPVLVVAESRRADDVAVRLRQLYRSVEPAGHVDRLWRERFGLSARMDRLHLFVVRDPLVSGIPDLTAAQ